ncbi:MAG: glycosyltransferase [Candidatus Thioglobus sp.]
MEKPHIAILLAAYNGKVWLQEQLESILHQDEVDVQIFISVDQSSDGTEDFVDQFAAADTRITILPHGQKFGGAVSNFFRLINDVSFDGFDYVSFSDQDDIWSPDKLIRANCKMLAMGADGYSSNVTAFWPSGRQMLIKKSQPQREWDFLFEAGGPGCTYVMTVKLAQIIQQYIHKHQTALKDVWLHDWFCYSFSRAKGFKWFIDDYSSLMYRQHLDNQVGVNSGWKALLYRVKQIVGGQGIKQSILIARLMKLDSNPFVKKWMTGERLGLIWLAFKARSCRRRLRDQILFVFSCLIMAVMGPYQI